MHTEPNSVLPIDVLAARLCAEHADIAKASDACDNARRGKLTGRLAPDLVRCQTCKLIGERAFWTTQVPEPHPLPICVACKRKADRDAERAILKRNAPYEPQTCVRCFSDTSPFELQAKPLCDRCRDDQPETRSDWESARREHEQDLERDGGEA